MLPHHTCSYVSRLWLISLLLLILGNGKVMAQQHKEVAERDTVILFRGVAVSVDAVGLVQMAVGSYGQYEGALRVNLRDKYFPIIEVGYATADAENEITSLRYKTKAPYGRVGIDFNLLKNKHDVNRFYGGVRYAYTNYKFNVTSNGVEDPTWGNDVSFGGSDIKASQHWMELVAGIDAKIYKNFRMGWSVRYKRRIAHDDGNIGGTWYVPGYGKTGDIRLGGTFNITLEF